MSTRRAALVTARSVAPAPLVRSHGSGTRPAAPTLGRCRPSEGVRGPSLVARTVRRGSRVSLTAPRALSTRATRSAGLPRRPSFPPRDGRARRLADRADLFFFPADDGHETREACSPRRGGGGADDHRGAARRRFHVRRLPPGKHPHDEHRGRSEVWSTSRARVAIAPPTRRASYVTRGRR